MHQRIRHFLLLCTVAAATALSLTPRAAAAQEVVRSQSTPPGDDRWGLPGSPTGQALASVLDVIDSGTEEDIRAFVQESFEPEFRNAFPMEDHIGFFQSVHDQFTPFTLSDVRRTGERSAATTLEAESGKRVVLEIELSEAGKISTVGFSPAEPAEDEIASLDELDNRLRAATANGEFSGTVLVADDANVSFLQSYGLANQETGDANNDGTRYNIGSLNKMFTGVATLQLAEAGKLDLDATIGTYLSGFPEDVAGSVTVRHLLRHRSGWGAYWSHPYYVENRTKLQTVEHYMAFLRDVPLDFEPGTRQQYSNTGYEVLGAIIEAVSGLTYYDYIREHIYIPAGMTHSDSYAVSEDVDNMAMGYIEGPEGFTQPNINNRPIKGTPAGGGYSTANDLLRFNVALRGHELLSKAWTDLYFNNFEGEPGREPEAGYNIFAGGGPGINATFGFEIPSGLTVVVLTNFDPPTAEQAIDPIMRFMEAQ